MDQKETFKSRSFEVETQDKDELTDIKEGDVINLWDLLFSEKRDYLIKYNGHKVKAEQLGGKAMLIYFVPVSLDLSSVMETEYTTLLIDIYNDLLPNNDFEVIVVAVDEIRANFSFPQYRRDPEKNFELMFSRMPWIAIPFSDKASRKRLARRFGISGGNFSFTISFFLDSKGILLTRNACPYFRIYGTLGYPFTDERIKYLKSEDDEAANHPSLETLLGSPLRDYVISNKEDRVPIHSLKDKVVALYFYEDGLTDDELTVKLKMAYKGSAKTKENFEVVLLYLYDTQGTLHSTNEESFWKTFRNMPWLALPFKDPNHKKLRRIFGYPNDLNGPERPPTLVIFGPNGEFVEPCGGDILMDFGAHACPFTRKRLAKLETEKIKELKLEMLWDPNTVFRVVKDGLEASSFSNLLKFENALSKIRSKLEMLWDPITFVRVKHRLEFLPNFYPLVELMIPNSKIPFSQFTGKRVLIYFEWGGYYEHSLKLSMMKEIYLQKKGTGDEFEVIHIKKSLSNNKFVAGLPWLVHYYGEGYSLPAELEESIFNFQYDHGLKPTQKCLLLAFERDGSIVRKTFKPTFDNNLFPFFAGGLEEEFLDQINFALRWSYWKYQSQKKPIYKSRQ
ncbi:putative nucleoredoxin 1 isoform X2 [Apium graveolens]|uniref:putative nucleoredoxin 1 isoform X2 n=1 Tax=Apium graveolens TaxID=4045 RepID=UPI003D7B5DD4